MPSKKKWKILSDTKVESEKSNAALIEVLLQNRGIESAKDREAFLDGQLKDVTIKSVGIDKKHLDKTVKRIQKAIEAQEKIVVFGDYDVDGITGSAILWETLHELGANALPYIPNRLDEGYGLSIRGIDNITAPDAKTNDVSLVITVDNGIVANEQVAYAKEKGLDVIITDHHTVGEALPDAYAIVHTTKLCGAGVAYLLAQELVNIIASEEKQAAYTRADRHLELAALGTVADLVPLTGANRIIVREGLKRLQDSDRAGLLALFDQAGIKQDEISVYDIGFKIGPRLNAAGRLESAMDSLRLLCTPSGIRAGELAIKLEVTNRERQQIMKESAEDAILRIKSLDTVKPILVIGQESYAEGVIGLIAGKLVEEFYRPAIVLSIGPERSKASVRSINGFNVIEFLRLHSEYFINVGGHPMAAGFTVETAKLQALKEALEMAAEEMMEEELFIRELKIDCELPFSVLSRELYASLQQLSPFGMGNPEPVFATKAVKVENIRVLGKEANHLKLTVSKDGATFDAIAFGMGELAADLSVDDEIDLAYTLDENTWRDETKLQLKVRDIQV